MQSSVDFPFFSDSIEINLLIIFSKRSANAILLAPVPYSIIDFNLNFLLN